MKDFVIAHFDALLTVGVTILGFVINYFVTKKNFQEEIRKEKISKNTEVIQALPYAICVLMNKILNKGETAPQLYTEIMLKILSYGSRDAVKIAIKLLRMTHSLSEYPEGKRILVLSPYALLITQLKYDLSAEIISPECWFEMCISDYETVKTEMRKSINDIVNELELNESFYV